MLYWLAQAAKQAREAAGRKQVHVAASANKDQSSIYRFEAAQGWSRDTDLILAAYADDLDIDPRDPNLERWREGGRWTGATRPREDWLPGEREQAANAD